MDSGAKAAGTTQVIVTEAGTKAEELMVGVGKRTGGGRDTAWLRAAGEVAAVSFSSKSFAKPTAWVKEVGLRMANSFWIVGRKPEIKQLSNASGGKPTTILLNRSKFATYSVTVVVC